MIKKIFLGAEGKATGIQGERTGTGVYTSLWGDTNSGPITLTTPVYETKTPRAIISNDENVYLLTRQGLAKISPHQTSFEITTPDKIFTETVTKVHHEQRGRVEYVIKNPEMQASMIIHENNLLIAMWLENKEEWSKFLSEEENKNLKIHGEGGYLFIAPNMDLEKLALIPQAKPTGAITTSNNQLYSINGNIIDVFNLNESKEKKSHYQISERIPSSAPILSFTTTDNTKLWTDVKGNYHLRTNSQEWSSKPGQPFDIPVEERKLSLPSESHACGLIKYKDRMYAIIGLDDGKIRIYAIENNKPRYEQTISLLSLDQIIQESDKKNYITNVQIDGQDVQITFRNWYIRWDIKHLLNVNTFARIKTTDTVNPTTYLEKMRETYDLAGIIQVPHRITTLNVWEGS